MPPTTTAAARLVWGVEPLPFSTPVGFPSARTFLVARPLRHLPLTVGTVKLIAWRQPQVIIVAASFKPLPLPLFFRV